MKKIYCYVDETGQDTKGRIFIVTVVVAEKERDKLLELCEQFEKVSGKGKFKWNKAKHNLRIRFLKLIFADDRFYGRLRYSISRKTKEYDTVTINTIAGAVRWKKPKTKFTTLIYVDGLSKTKRQEYGVRLRRLGLPVRQVRGIARDESNSLIRLADTVAGFVRDALESKKEDLPILFREVKRKGMLVEI